MNICYHAGMTLKPGQHQIEFQLNANSLDPNTDLNDAVPKIIDLKDKFKNALLDKDVTSLDNIIVGMAQPRHDKADRGLEGTIRVIAIISSSDARRLSESVEETGIILRNTAIAINEELSDFVIKADGQTITPNSNLSCEWFDTRFFFGGVEPLSDQSVIRSIHSVGLSLEKK